jgi:hypothetical protein
LNACSLCGYLETVSSPAPMPAAGRAGTTAPKAKQKSGLFARLRERLGLQVG